jgi:hypothetical protein
MNTGESGVSKSTPCYGMMLSLLFELGRHLSNPLKREGLPLG